MFGCGIHSKFRQLRLGLRRLEFRAIVDASLKLGFLRGFPSLQGSCLAYA